MDGHDLTDRRRRFGSRLGGGSDRRYVTPDQGRHQPSAGSLPAEDSDVGRLHHGIGGLDHGDIAAGLYHPQCVVHGVEGGSAVRLVVGEPLPRHRCCRLELIGPR